MKALVPPIRFTIDDEPFEFTPLPLGTLLLIEQMKAKLNINQEMLQATPIAEWLIVTKHQTNDVRRIVCLLLEKDKLDLKRIKERSCYLRDHCTVEDLCSLFIIGTIAQNLWLRDTGKLALPATLEGVCERDLWTIPFVQLLKNENYGRIKIRHHG